MTLLGASGVRQLLQQPRQRRVSILLMLADAPGASRRRTTSPSSDDSEERRASQHSTGLAVNRQLLQLSDSSDERLMLPAASSRPTIYGSDERISIRRARRSPSSIDYDPRRDVSSDNWLVDRLGHQSLRTRTTLTLADYTISPRSHQRLAQRRQTSSGGSCCCTRRLCSIHCMKEHETEDDYGGS